MRISCLVSIPNNSTCSVTLYWPCSGSYMNGTEFDLHNENKRTHQWNRSGSLTITKKTITYYDYLVHLNSTKYCHTFICRSPASPTLNEKAVPGEQLCLTLTISNGEQGDYKFPENIRGEWSWLCGLYKNSISDYPKMMFGSRLARVATSVTRGGVVGGGRRANLSLRPLQAALLQQRLFNDKRGKIIPVQW